MTLDIQAIKARRQAITPGEWVAHEGTVHVAPFVSFVGNLGRQAHIDAEFIAAAPADIDALLAEVERLTAAIRNAETLSELTHLVGPSDEENEDARRRLEQIEGINTRYGVDIAKWPDHVYMKYTRLKITQGSFERRYA